MEVYCVGCKSKVESASEVSVEAKQTSKGVKHILRTTCSKGHKVTNIVKKQ